MAVSIASLCINMHQTKSATLVQPNPIRFFGFNPILGPMLGFKRVALALRIQKRVQLGQVDIKKGLKSDFYVLLYFHSSSSVIRKGYKVPLIWGIGIQGV